MNVAPNAMLRGGYHGYGSRSGVFNTILSYAPSFDDVAIGFRCAHR